ncbi:hypothetical protein BKA70DRAFT_1153136 [Coprinopsis sp. MPI-PUGE-AT-0042]|nr:hypothetical protein BKA70DRAFT_1153136 [Coprinopsis sp. MPI-PUGE-AT-0042]
MTTAVTFPQRYSPQSNNNMTQLCLVYVGLVVDGVLDVGKLKSAHQRLVELWPAVGGTLDKSTSPWSFTTGSHVDFNARTLDQNLADLDIIPFKNASSTLPTLHKLGSTADNTFHFDTMNDWLPPDLLFSLRVTILRDATLLGMRFSHHLCDGQACYDIAKAYCDIVNDRAPLNLIPPPDISCFLSEKINGEDKLLPSVRPGNHTVGPQSNSVTPGAVPLLTHIGSCVWGKCKAKVGLEEQEDDRMVHLPSAFVSQLRARCQAELDNVAKNGELEEGAGLEVTKNDVVTAWILKGAYAAFPPSDTQTLNIYYNLNYRPFLDPLPPNQCYIHNSFYSIRTHLDSLSKFQNSPLSRIALESKLTVTRNKQPSVVKATVQFYEARPTQAFAPYPTDEKCAIKFVPYISHWTGFEFNSLDFSGALKIGSGKVIYTQPRGGLPVNIATKLTVFILKDGRGGYWMRTLLLGRGWKGVEGRLSSGKND